ncbi:50S ribosomal protein L13 [Candidatus Roizmanbacteria bacterium RIFCSPLOWO2_12_FULL_40_12]|uniref:Large ribosomal subunit protein uL13 n=1 Tax=Candidatus Roizmanbacteria bacterium RIFCSPLOWO2_01_FULL_40_42 TaxID=1802066 RepID=A0A1F7J4J8_9BACT|nr:MAG: 50S ribosomal protein L13 [Candidatus Roizmanbacteria bacterium RIFCSPHIGHO2_01_FULL_40_98]OGK27299.1 MAG: 50S ribosomal protein L13 [Candidatus Roizmanbacteria bacterium RIFCSPHIGHO2_02_FULL_40_53]OGK30829.1 MAG: 50S ribosomal protein L13 [Candidatus Roizmanbacteria bacterium RIFCSPHIGHO2_12_41_18]OGK36404.1 MAG: 50S ribosomal protein L13 [Candidatus Roizmanbacteria bacterium RIFCSPHIGHO2_12_FULL_40_130]OGK50532.1 MAG: 50S ribosomal protein L13 [Candidatus Roizmanbacteria bacterium RIF
MVTLTKSTKPQKEADIKRSWHLIDLKGKVLGRAAVSIAGLIQGKHKTARSFHFDGGDYVVAINAKDIVMTGRKLSDKVYTRYSGYPGGLRTNTAGEILSKNPKELVRHAVSGMLPKNKLRKPRLTRLFIFPDAKHPYEEKLASKGEVKK